MSQWFKRGRKWRATVLHIRYCNLLANSKKSTNQDMTAVFHTWSYGRFIEIQRNLRRKKLRRTDQGSNFLGSSFSNRINARAPIQFRRESQHQHDFSSRTDPSISTSIASVILNQSNETIWGLPVLKSTSHFLPQSTVSSRSSCCCHKSDVWPHLEKRVVS